LTFLARRPQTPLDAANEHGILDWALAGSENEDETDDDAGPWDTW
jgi:hypothetical protein